MMKYPWLVVFIHTILVLLLATLVFVEGGEVVMLWNLFMIIDFPMVVITSPFNENIEALLSQLFPNLNVKFSVGYALLFGTLGGVQYFFITHCVCFLVAKKKSNASSK